MTEESSKALTTQATSVYAVKPVLNRTQQKRTPAPQTITTCNNCGGNHVAEREKCPAFGQQCHYCRKLNHYKSCCRSRPVGQSSTNRRASRQSVLEVGVDHTSTCEDDTFHVDGVDVDNYVDCISSHTSYNDEGFVTIHINGVPTEIKVDTGAKCNVMSFDTFKLVANGEQLVKQRTATNLVAYGGTRIKTSGVVTLPCYLQEQCHLLPFFIVDKGVRPLLGSRACKDMGIVQMSPDVHHVNTEDSFSSHILSKYKDLFSDELGKLPLTYSMTVDSSAQPVVRPPHCIPVAMQERVRT